MPTLLIADDNAQITSILGEYAKKEGYRPLIALTGAQALDLYARHSPDALLLDVMMPEVDGFSVCREVRRSSTVPILMITARGEDYEKIMGLDTGADDYIVKPFSPGEVMARLRAVMRRACPAEQSEQALTVDSLRVSLKDYTASVDGQPVPLTRKEIEILWTLVEHKSRAFTRDQLLNSVWGYDYTGDSRTVDSHIKRLRAKLDEYAHPTWEIRTIWGVGYKFEALP